jgi:hypothetical protein
MGSGPHSRPCSTPKSHRQNVGKVGRIQRPRPTRVAQQQTPHRCDYRRHRSGRRLGCRFTGRIGLQRQGFYLSTTARAGRTPSQHKGASMPPKTIATTATRCTAFFTIPSKAATTAPVKPTYTAWRRFPPLSSTSAWRKGVPFAREYGGLLDNRSFGGTQVSRTFYARGQTGQQLLIGAYQALSRQVALGTVKLYNRHEMLDVGGRRQMPRYHRPQPAHRRTRTPWRTRRGALYRRLRQRVLPEHQRHDVQHHRRWRAHRRGAFFGNPCYTQIHPTCIPVSGEYQSKLTLMSESLRNDGGLLGAQKRPKTA